MEQFNRNKKIKFEDKEIHKKFYGVVMNESKINCHIQVFEAAKSIDDKTFVNQDYHQYNVKWLITFLLLPYDNFQQVSPH